MLHYCRQFGPAGTLGNGMFAGSGTTLAVAKKLGRDWLGCEMSKDYAVLERINAVSQEAAGHGKKPRGNKRVGAKVMS